MGISTEAQEFADRLEEVVTRRSGAPGFDLATLRDTVESLHLAATEPEGVTYADVDVEGVRGIWAIPEGADNERALLHFHFGGSVVASAHTDRKAAGHIAKAAGVRSLIVDFRRAPEHPYPAQVDDALAAYDWLLSQGYRSENIGSTGHSIGGYLAVALALRLRDAGRAMPAAVLSISPWCDLRIQNETITSNAQKDKMISRDTLHFFREMWLGGADLEFTDPQLSLINADLTGLPPTSVYYGGYEVLAGEAAEFGQRLLEFGVDSKAHELEGGQHSFILAAGKVPEVDAAIAEMGTWLRANLQLPPRDRA